MTSSTPLFTIIALARAGALDHAWKQFAASGYDDCDDDPAAFTVKGRLLKDRAIRADGETRQRFFHESAEAYRRAAALQPGTYPLINAATLSLLSGDRTKAQEIAREVLDRIRREPDEPETPYWRAATEAEALLLLGRLDEGRSRLSDAMSAAPRAWEDHASTLRQFLLIHDAIREDPSWLDILRPPRSLAYWGGGSGALQSNDRPACAADLVASDRIGFGFGGLAAGWELEVAEALLAAGAELHVILPSDSETFARNCVDPLGGDWRARFEAALSAAETVHLVRPLHRVPDEASGSLASLVAAGAARLNAERLMSEAREIETPSRHPGEHSNALALLSISMGSADDDGFEGRVDELKQILEAGAPPAIPPHLSGDEALIGYREVTQASETASAIQRHFRGRQLRIAGHYGFVDRLLDPFVSCLRPSQKGAAILKAVAQAAPPDTACVSLDFAAALAASSGAASCANWIGELHAFDGGTGIALYALRPPNLDD